MRFSDKPKYMESYFIHGKNVTPRWDYSHHLMPPITSSVTFRLENVERGAKGFLQYAQLEDLPEEPIYIYERLEDPTTAMLEGRLSTAEKGDTAVTFSTGMAAVSACACTLLKGGNHLLAHYSLYGCTYSLFQNWLPRHGIGVDFVDMIRDANWSKAINKDTRVVYFETPINPTLELIDIAAVRKVVDSVNASRGDDEKVLIVVDNTFASPYCQRPLELGADIVVGSLTKHIGGFNTGMGGYIACPNRFHNQFLMCRKDYGAALHAKTAWNFLVYGLPTLPCRLRQQTETASKLAEFLTTRPEVKEVHYPGLPTHPYHDLARKQLIAYDGSFAPGALIYFVLKGSPEEAKKKGTVLINWLANNALSYTLAVSLGCIKTLVEQPSSMTHAAIPLDSQLSAGIEPGGIRVSVGLEEPGILIEELTLGLGQI